jgi:two-component system response regulator RegX3
MTKILIVEDEPSISEAIAFMLSKEGFEVVIAETGTQALSKFYTEAPDLILLDLMIPEISGTEVCRTIRTKSQVPIIMLTAKDSEIDKVVGLELGADDYVTKLQSGRELTARIKAVLRRQTNPESEGANPGIFEIGTVRVDIDRHQVSVNGIAASLPLKEFQLLEYLIRNAGRVLPRHQIIDRIWGADYYGDTKTLDVHIKRLRAKIEVNPGDPKIIQTIRGLGYKYEA